jgi:hypothetical protein
LTIREFPGRTAKILWLAANTRETGCYTGIRVGRMLAMARRSA